MDFRPKDRSNVLQVQPRSSWIPLAFSVLVLVSNCHCRAGAAERLTSATCLAHCRTVGDGQPVGFPTGGCANESGCMCRGALTIDNFDVFDVLDQIDRQCFVDATTCFFGADLDRQADAGTACGLAVEACWPLSGKTLRAYLCTLLI